MKTKPPGASIDEGAPEIKWTPNAPRELISLHGKIRLGRDVLGRLLHDPRMNRAWVEIDKRIEKRAKAPGGIPSREAYQRLWTAITSGLSQANRNSKPVPKHGKKATSLPHSERKKQCLKIERIASQLAGHLDNGPLDLHAYEFFPEDVVHLARGVNCNSTQDAARLALEWTTLRDLLLQLALKARAEAKKKPLVAKQTKEFRSNYFIRPLAEHFEHHFDGPFMHASLAAIANAVLDRDASKALTDKDVKRALSHQGGKREHK